jgi:hypothetical protein
MNVHVFFFFSKSRRSYLICTWSRRKSTLLVMFFIYLSCEPIKTILMIGIMEILWSSSLFFLPKKIIYYAIYMSLISCFTLGWKRHDQVFISKHRYSAQLGSIYILLSCFKRGKSYGWHLTLLNKESWIEYVSWNWYDCFL